MAPFQARSRRGRHTVATVTRRRRCSTAAVSVEVMADRATMSPRTFARRFRATTGTTPGQRIGAQCT